ncbi:MAG: PRC-barrel domain-containing protein [Candidatus Korobacteraceae bacterium]
MPHYAALRDYEFEVDADDIRGAILRDSSGDKLGTVTDAIIEHESGEVHYLIAEIGGREVMVPAERVLPSMEDDDLPTDLTRTEAETLPELQGFPSMGSSTAASPMVSGSTMSGSRVQRRARKDYEEKQDERAEEQFKENYTEGAVAHREGSDRLITPEASEMPAFTGDEDIDSSNLTPNRITDKFGGVGQPITAPTGIPRGASGAPDLAGRTTLEPIPNQRAEDASRPGSSRGKRWDRFASSLQSRLPRMRETCNVCGRRHSAA